jgi:hypothetical protein
MKALFLTFRSKKEYDNSGNKPPAAPTLVHIARQGGDPNVSRNTAVKRILL